MNKKITVILAAVVMVLVFVLGTYLYQNSQETKISGLGNHNSAPFVREYSQTYGSENAKVILVEFFDPACETCGAFYPFIKKIMSQYPDKIKLVVRYAPFHQGADYFVKILEAARLQGKYWETLEVMYKTQAQWASHHSPKPELIWGFLEEVNMDLEQVKKDMESPEVLQILKQDLEDVKTLNVQKTPGFFVNGKPLINFGYGNLRNLIVSEVEANYGK